MVDLTQGKRATLLLTSWTLALTPPWTGSGPVVIVKMIAHRVWYAAIHRRRLLSMGDMRTEVAAARGPGLS